MKNGNKITALILCAALQIAVLSACGDTSGTESPADNAENTANTDTSVTAPATVVPSAVPSASDIAVPQTPAEADLSGATVITLSGSSAQINGSGAEQSNGVITITAGGTYEVSGTLEEGRIIVNASGKDVTLVLNGASITCSYGSPIYIYKSSSTTIHLMEGTQNTLTDGENYTFADSLSSAADEEPNACLYSKSDLIIQGAGALTVKANYKNGITSKDTLEIYDAALTVTAVNHGINGKDSNTIDSASISVTCGGDAIRSSNDTDSTLGWVSVSNSTLTLTAGEDGIQAETWASLSSGSYTITSGGGSSVAPRDDVSAKGIKAGTALILTSGVYVLDCSDDALHANGDVTISGGVYTISTGDDGAHADETLTVSGGQMNILKSYEGLEGSNVDISGGEITLISLDDGVNAAGGVDGSGFGGRGMGNLFDPAGSSYALTISGGFLHVTAGGDGLDSNGSITMAGGTVLVSSTGNSDGALDYDAGFSLEGGVLLAASSGNMAQAPSNPGQYTMSVQFGSTLPAGTYVQFASTDHEFVFQLSAPANHIVFSSPELKSGAVYSISYGGEYSGESTGGLCTGGTYSGGTLLTEMTLSDVLTTYGQVGMGGSKGGNMIGGAGQHGSFGRGGMEPPGEMPPEIPTGTGNEIMPGDKRNGQPSTDTNLT
ncbi:MAG: carbohydrate-binding domain-containing protein [Oscillospiraceae bacterium]